MSNISSKRISRRQFLAVTGALSAGALLAACTPAATPAPAATQAAAAPAATQAPAVAPNAGAITIRAHMVKKSDVSDWIQMGIDQDIDGFKAKNPNITIKLETIPGWTAEYNPKILSFAAAGSLGDAMWYPPRHRSHIAWGVQYNVVRDIRPLAEGAGYDLSKNFYAGANDANSFQGKQYWMSYISEPIVPVIAYNKSKIKEMGISEPTDDWTFADLAQWAKSATKGDVFGYAEADRGHDPFGGGPYFRQWGVDAVDADGKKATYQDQKDQLTSALKFSYDLIANKVSPSPSSGAINAPELYGGQKVLAVDIWPFRIQIYPATFKNFEHGFVLTPVVNKGDKRRSMLNEHVFGITNLSKNPDAAFKFLTWIGGKEMNVQALVQGQKGPIARPDVWADDRIYGPNPTYKKLKPIMEAIEPDFVVGNFRGEEYDAAFIAVTDAVELGKIAPADAVAQCQSACQAVLDKQPA
jgi:ABC-type glycerol-3-phosphate transport system substrate-binding protein